MANNDKTSDNVKPAADDATAHLNFDSQTETREPLPDLVIRLGGKTWTIPEPDGELVMELEEVSTTRAALALIFDDQWHDAGPLVGRLYPADLMKLVSQYARHFEVDMQAMQVQAAPNRAERRALRRRKS